MPGLHAGIAEFKTAFETERHKLATDILVTPSKWFLKYVDMRPMLFKELHGQYNSYFDMLKEDKSNPMSVEAIGGQQY